MSSVVLILRAFLVAVFLTAGIAKLTDLEESRNTVEAFGVPHRIAQIAGSAIPFAEIVTAIALLPQASARWGSIAALLLLLVFSAGTAYALSQGRRPGCNCFGQVSSQQISNLTVARNAIIALPAAIAIWKGPGASPSAWTSNHAAADLTAFAAVLISALLVMVVMRLRAQLEAAVTLQGSTEANADGALKLGAQAPTFTLENLERDPVSLEALLQRDLPVVLVFGSPTCGPCVQMMPELARWSAAVAESLTIAVIESGVRDHDHLKTQFADAHELMVLAEPDSAVSDSYSVRGTPSAVAIGPDGVTISNQALGALSIENLVRTVLSGELQSASAVA